MIPVTIISWFRATKRPRIWAGASSEINTGTILEAVPTPKPRITRATIITGTLGAKAAIIAPTTKIADAAINTGRLPK